MTCIIYSPEKIEKEEINHISYTSTLQEECVQNCGAHFAQLQTPIEGEIIITLMTQSHLHT